MKNCEIGWAGLIPDNWTTMKNKFNFTLHKNIVGGKYNDFQLLSLTKNGVKVIKDGEQTGKVPASLGTYQIVDENDLVMCLFDLDCSAVFSGVSKYTGIISPAYKCYKCKDHLFPGYVDYYFRTVFVGRKYMKYSKNVRFSISSDEFMNLPIIVPPIEQQIKISKILDEKCYAIDSTISSIEEQISILENFKKNHIKEKVCHGLKKNEKLKQVNIDYIEDIPESWEIKKGKYLFKYIQKAVLPTDDVITCFRDGQVTLRSNRREEGFTISEKEIGYQGIDIGDLVVHGMDGFAGAIGISDSRGKASPVLNVLDTDYSKKYYMYLLRTMAYYGVFEALSTGIRVRTCDTNWGKLREIFYIVPPKEEQELISDYLDKKCAEIDAIIADKKAQLETLEEYKKSLIYEYVTGKKEVPNE